MLGRGYFISCSESPASLALRAVASADDPALSLAILVNVRNHLLKVFGHEEEGTAESGAEAL